MAAPFGVSPHFSGTGVHFASLGHCPPDPEMVGESGNYKAAALPRSQWAPGAGQPAPPLSLSLLLSSPGAESDAAAAGTAQRQL